MRSTARPLTMITLLCCLVANWAARAQEPLQGSSDVAALPSSSGASATGGAAALLSVPATIGIGPATSGPLPGQFTPSNARIGTPRTGAILAGKNSSAAGDPCLTAKAYTRPDFATKNLQQNWISAKNTCGRYIKISVCYAGTENCASISVPPWQTKNVILGYAPRLGAGMIHYHISLEN